MFKSIFNGKPKYKESKTKFDYRKALIKPNNRFRIIVQQKPTKGNNYEECKSVMVYDFTGKLTTTGLIKKIQKALRGNKMTKLGFGWDEKTKEKYWEINGKRVSQEEFEDFAIQEGILKERSLGNTN